MREPGSFLYTSLRRFEEVAQLLEKLVVRLPELQAIKSIACFRGQLNRREVLRAIHRPRLARLLLRSHKTMVCQLGDVAVPIPVRTTEPQRETPLFPRFRPCHPGISCLSSHLGDGYLRRKGGRRFNRCSPRVEVGACPPSVDPVDGSAAASRSARD